MGSLFPSGPGIGRVRGIVQVIKENGGQIEISELAEESKVNIDELLPIIEAASQLGFIRIVESQIELTNDGAKLHGGNANKMIRERLLALEPFKSAKKVIGSREKISSDELFGELYDQGFVMHGERSVNDALLKKIFIRWPVRARLFKYNVEDDIWSLVNN